MERKNCSELSNAQIRIYLETLKNEREASLAKARKIKEEIDTIDAEIFKANNELTIRKNIY